MKEPVLSTADIIQIKRSIVGCEKINIDEAKEVIWIDLKDGQRLGPFNISDLKEFSKSQSTKISSTKNTYTRATMQWSILQLETDAINRTYIPRCDKWVRFLNNVPKFYAKKERELFEKYEKGDHKAFEEIITFMIPQIITYVDKYSTQGLYREDLIQECTLTIMDAIEKFDCRFGNRFLSYVSVALVRTINYAEIYLNNKFAFPIRYFTEKRNIQNIIDTYEQEYNIPPTLEYLAERINLPIDKLEENIFYDYVMRVSDDKLFEDAERVYDYSNPADDGLILEGLTNHIDAALKGLTQRDADVIRKFYGIGIREESIEEIGDDLHLTSLRVQQIKETAIRKLRTSSSISVLKTYLFSKNPYYPYYPSIEQKQATKIYHDDDEFNIALKKIPGCYVDINQVYEMMRLNTEFLKIKKKEELIKLREGLEKAIIMLPMYESRVLRHYFGIGVIKKSIDEIAKYMKIGYKDTCRYYNKGIKKIDEKLITQYLIVENYCQNHRIEE